MLVICKHCVSTVGASFSWRARKWVVLWNMYNLVIFFLNRETLQQSFLCLWKLQRRGIGTSLLRLLKTLLFAFVYALFENFDGQGRECGSLNVCLTGSLHTVIIIFLMSNFRNLKQTMARSNFQSLLSPDSDRQTGLRAGRIKQQKVPWLGSERRKFEPAKAVLSSWTVLLLVCC